MLHYYRVYIAQLSTLLFFQMWRKGSCNKKECCNRKGRKASSDVFNYCNSVLRYGWWNNESIATDVERYWSSMCCNISKCCIWMGLDIRLLQLCFGTSNMEDGKECSCNGCKRCVAAWKCCGCVWLGVGSCNSVFGYWRWKTRVLQHM